MKKLAFALAFLALTGCAENPFRKFYIDKTGGMDYARSERFLQPDGDPLITSGSNLDADAQRMFEDGYFLLGYSAFIGPSGQEEKARDQAEQLHAAVAIVYSDYNDTLSGSMPVTMPTTQTSYTNAQATAYGSGGMVNAYGNSTTTTYGSTTSYVPFSINRSKYFASYWVKSNPDSIKLGCRVNDLTDEQRRGLASNKGVQVVTVIKGTPAFSGDIMKGDIIRSVGGDDAFDARSFHDLVNKHAKETVEIRLVRDGRPITKKIKLN